MNVKALLDIDLVALESTEKVTMMLDMTAPFAWLLAGHLAR